MAEFTSLLDVVQLVLDGRRSQEFVVAREALQKSLFDDN